MGTLPLILNICFLIFIREKSKQPPQILFG